MEINLLSSEFIGSSILALGGAAVWLRKQRVGLSKDEVEVAVSESNVAAQTAIASVIELLHSEVARLNAANSGLSQQIITQKAVAVAMHDELSTLRNKNITFEKEVSDLRKQVADLQTQISIMGDCSQCKLRKPLDFRDA